MTLSSMSFVHQSAPWEWTLEKASATRLTASNEPRWLLVTAGRVWLTRSGAGLAGGDIWLGAGERQALPPGSEWVVEAWPEGRVALLQAPVRQLGVGPRALPWLATSQAA